MKTLKIAYNMLVHRFATALFIAVQIAALLLLSNTVIAAYNSKNLLLKPYREILQNEGIVLDTSVMFEDESNNAEVQKYLSGEINTDGLIQSIQSHCNGTITVYRTDTLSLDEGIGAASTLYMEQGHNIEYFLMNEEIFDRLRMPLAEGRWASSEKTAKGEIEIVISQGTNAQLGQVYETPVGDLKVVGILTENTYRPPCSSFHRSEQERGQKASLFNYFESFDSNVSLGGAFALANQKLFPAQSGAGYNIGLGGIWFVSYGSDLTPEQVQQNTAYLKTIGNVQKDEDFHTLLQSGQAVVNNIYLQMLPIMIAAVIVVLSGLIGTVALSTLQNLRTFGIFFLCGCSWGKMVKIISAYLALIFVGAVVCFILAMGGMSAMNLSYTMGFSYEVNNIWSSILLMGILYLLAILLPYSLIKTTSPIETVKENQK